MWLMHCHHEDLIEKTDDPQERFRCVENKPPDEVELRFALFTVIDGEDAELLDAALAEYNKVRAPAWEEYNKVCAPAWEEYNKVYDEIHARRCHPNCPWDGKTIFSKGKDAKVLWPSDTLTADPR